MLTYAVILFALAAVGGLYLAIRHLRDTAPPVPLALVHGLFGAAGLVLLLLVALDAGGDLVTFSLVLFAAAAVGGFFLFARHLRGQALGASWIAGHALVAVIGFVLLLVALLG